MDMPDQQFDDNFQPVVTPEIHPDPSSHPPVASNAIPIPTSTLRRSTRPRKARVIREVEPLIARARSPAQAENTPQGRSNEETPAEGSALYDNDIEEFDSVSTAIRVVKVSYLKHFDVATDLIIYADKTKIRKPVLSPGGKAQRNPSIQVMQILVYIICCLEGFC